MYCRVLLVASTVHGLAQVSGMVLSIKQSKWKTLGKTLRDTYNILKKNKRPFSITYASKKLGITYSAAKSRLHALVVFGMLNLAKEGSYYVGKRLNIPKKAKGYLAKLNGKIYLTNKEKFDPRLEVYNSRIGRSRKYVTLQREGDIFILRIVPRGFGCKLSPHIGGSTTIYFHSKEMLTKRERSYLTKHKSVPVTVGVYPKEFGLKLEEVFGTESIYEGQLCKHLIRFFDLRKPKRSAIKADILITTRMGTIVPIEITTARYEKTKGRSNIKTYEILGKLYFGVKWTEIHKSPFIMIVHTFWKDAKWLQKEIDYLKAKRVFVLFSNFSGRWASKTAYEIKSLIDDICV